VHCTAPLLREVVIETISLHESFMYGHNLTQTLLCNAHSYTYDACKSAFFLHATADEDAEYIDINSSANDDNDSDSTTTSRVYTSKKPKSTFYSRLHVWAVHITATYAFRKAVQANTLLLAVLSVTWTAHRQLLYFLCTVGPDALLAANSSKTTVTTTTVSGSVNSTMHELTPQQQHVQNSIHRGIAADESCTVYLLLHMAEGLLLILFAVEIWLKIVAKGTKNYLRASRWHWFDLFIASSSLVAFTATTTGVFAARYILNHKLVSSTAVY
jgi:Ion transport protein